MPRAVVLLVMLLSCKERVFRGWLERTPDGGTMLSIDDDCGPDPTWIDKTRVKGKTPIPVKPGAHTVSCGDKPGADIEVLVPAGRIFHFDYWGP